MRLMKAGAVQVVVLVIAMLAAIGGWEVSKAVVQQAHGGTGCFDQNGDPIPCPPPFDHFTCYKIHDKHPQSGFVAEVRIDNQFETSISRVKDEDRLLCTPTAKTLISITPVNHSSGDHDDDHDRGKDYDKKGKK